MKRVNVEAKNGITTITAEIEIEASVDKVWKVLSEPGKIKDFHPLIKKSFMITDRQSGIGAKRHCDLLPMGAMDEVITAWEEGTSFSMEVIGGKMLPPYRFMKGKVILRQNQNFGTSATFSFAYQLKFGLLGQLMDVLLIRPQFKNAPPKYVEGLKSFVERKHT